MVLGGFRGVLKGHGTLCCPLNGVWQQWLSHQCCSFRCRCRRRPECDGTPVLRSGCARACEVGDKGGAKLAKLKGRWAGQQGSVTEVTGC